MNITRDELEKLPYKKLAKVANYLGVENPWRKRKSLLIDEVMDAVELMNTPLESKPLQSVRVTRIGEQNE